MGTADLEDGYKERDALDSANSCHNNTKGHKPQNGKDLWPMLAASDQSWPEAAVPPRGVEEGAFSSGNKHISEAGGPQSGPHDDASPPVEEDPALSLLIHAWPALSPADQKVILDIVRRASVGEVRQ